MATSHWLVVFLAMAATFVTGNEKKWAEVQAILGAEIHLKRQNMDGTAWQPTCLYIC